MRKHRRCIFKYKFEFPIGEITKEVPMKVVPLSSLPNLHGSMSEDPNTFVFEFDILCQSFDYTSNA